jgi:tetratricopeptide (TPR) repeat protein
MRQANIDDFNQILEVEDFTNLPNPKMVEPDMNKAIEKVIIVSNVHEPSDWVDDCYVLMAKAQYFKQDYETTETTLKYFQEVFNPKNPYGRNYFKSPYNKKKLKKIKEKEKKEIKAEKEKVKKEKAEDKKEAAKSKEKERKDRAKQKERERKQKAKDREKARKDKAKGIVTEKPSVTEKPAEKPSVKTTPDKTENLDENVEKPKEKKPEEDKTAYNEGLLWLAKTYIKRQNYYSAELILNKLRNNPQVTKQVRKEIPATFASLYIKQSKYQAALEELETAQKNTRDNELKARYAFIKGQLYEKEGRYAEAYKNFKIANKKSKNNNMLLMANMAILKNEFRIGKKPKDDVIASLDKMANEEKYLEQKHIIYFTMAQMELENQQLEKAINYFQLSLQNNTSDPKLKSDAYYIIATELYKKEMFYKSKLFYDSTLLVMNKNDKRYAEVDKRAKNLIDIAKNLEILAHQDTLLFLSELSGDEQKKAILQYAKSREKNQTNKESAAKPTSMNLKPSLEISKSKDLLATSSFFAYNKDSKEKGLEAFRKKWGRNTQLQDNWRLSSKAREIISSQDNLRDQEITEKQIEREYEDSPEYKNLLKEIPQNPVQKKEVQDKIINTMFALGKLYRNVIEKYKKSNDMLENMHTRFGPTQHELESYYHLVLNYRDLNQQDKAEEYVNKLIRKYPESTYAKILSDPEYLASVKEEAGKIDKFYEDTYKYFNSGNYKITLERIQNLKQQFGEENKYAAKIALLQAMCVGNTEGKEAYIKALNDVVIAFPNTQEQLKAREILRFLTGDAEAFSTVNEEESMKLYTFDETKPHFVAIVTYGLNEMQFVDVKISISEFNKNYFKTEKLQMTDAMLNRNENSQLIVIKKFANASEAMKYYKKVNQLKPEYIKGNVQYEVLPISQQNYLKMLGQYSSKAYFYFFEKHYSKIE